MASRLEECLATMIAVFHEYSGKQGDKYKLNQTELEAILEKELPNYYKSQKGKDNVKKLMKTLDRDEDGEVSFKEFVMLNVCLATACNDFFVDLQQKKCDK